MKEHTGIVIVGEMAGEEPGAITWELLAAGRKLANVRAQEVSVVFLGNRIGEDDVRDAIEFGADKVYIINDPLLEDHQTDAYVTAMHKICEHLNPEILLMGHTPLGTDLAPRIAFRLNSASSTDCVDVDIDPDTQRMIQTRSVYGGVARATMVCEETLPQIATIRPKMFSPLECDDSREGKIIQFNPEIDDSAIRARFIEFRKAEKSGADLEDAQIIVSGGRGIGSAENFAVIQELANILGGAVGASRPVCDNGWMPPSVQIGLTGKTVTPRLYIAVGISGSSQHMMGCSGSECIVVVNKDPEANMFKYADYGIVGDYKEIIPALIKALKST